MGFETPVWRFYARKSLSEKSDGPTSNEFTEVEFVFWNTPSIGLCPFFIGTVEKEGHQGNEDEIRSNPVDLDTLR